MLKLHNHLKRKLASGANTYGLWVTLESPTITEIAVALELDWVVVDIEHGHLDLNDVVNHLRVARNSQTTMLVRISEVQQGLIKRVLDIGAEGIVVPQITSVEEVRDAVRYAKYPPWGVRGVGGERSTNWGLTLAESTATANDETLIIPMIETAAAEAAVEEILDVRGVDAIFFGPADFSASHGHLGQWEGPGVAERILLLKDLIREQGRACGVMTTSIEDARQRQAQGFQMLGLMADTGGLIRALRQAQEALQQDA